MGCNWECDLNEMKEKTEHDSVNMGHMVTLPPETGYIRPGENIRNAEDERRGLAASTLGKGTSSFTTVFIFSVITEQQSLLITPLSHLLH